LIKTNRNLIKWGWGGINLRTVNNCKTMNPLLHVAIYFTYKGVGYAMDRYEFNDYVYQDGREGPRVSEYSWKVDHARAEA